MTKTATPPMTPPMMAPVLGGCAGGGLKRSAQAWPVHATPLTVIMLPTTCGFTAPMSVRVASEGCIAALSWARVAVELHTTVAITAAVCAGVA